MIKILQKLTRCIDQLNIHLHTNESDILFRLLRIFRKLNTSKTLPIAGEGSNLMKQFNLSDFQFRYMNRVLSISIISN